MNTGIPDRIIELITKSVVGELSTTERAELDQWLNSSEQNRLFFSQIENRGELRKKWKDYNESDEDQQWQRLAGDIPEINMAIAARSRIYKWSRFAIAAAVISVVSVTGWYFLTKNTTRKHEQNVTVASTQSDVAPGQFKAKLILDNGSIVILDSAKSGQLAQQGKTTIINKDGKLIYNIPSAGKGIEGTVLYNTLTTARGETYATELSDGSRIWLNSESSIRYPVSFTGNDRSVEITGEGYFEVKHNPQKPFKVHLPDGSIVEDIGTAFNVNSYRDEVSIKTTLIEGSVRIFQQNPTPGEGQHTVMLKLSNTEVNGPAITEDTGPAKTAHVGPAAIIFTTEAIGPV